MPTVDNRLAEIERRLADLEAAIAGLNKVPEQSPAPPPQHLTAASAGPVSLEQAAPAWPPAESSGPAWSATRILGWSGATALVLAAAYLIRLAVSGGWLTPERQIAFAVIAALGLIAVGLQLRKSDREYASLLPAGGIVILFLSIFGAHLYYQLIGVGTAGVSVIIVCLASLALCSLFHSQIYALFAVIGSYSAPFLLNTETGSITDLVIYYCSWSVLFCAYSIWVRDRRVYLLALYLALVGFDLLWRWNGSQDWQIEVAFQLSQFIIFTVCAVLYAIRHRAPMSQQIAISHAPALLIFYVLEYAVLDKYVAHLAPWIALFSAGLLLLAYRIARHYLGASLAGSKWLLAAYCALVLLHAGYLESVPDQWTPWVAPLLMTLSAVYLFMRRDNDLLRGPIGWVLGLIFIANYLRAVMDFNLDSVPASELLLIVYALQLYAGYYFVRREQSLSTISRPLIYAGHIAAMAAPMQLFDNQFAISLCWGVLALTCLSLSLRLRDKSLGQSSLLIFALSAIKVMLFDLSGATPLVRIACLAVLGVSFYLGGWLYKKIDAL